MQEYPSQVQAKEESCTCIFELNVIFRKDIAQSDKPDETRQRLVDDYVEKFANPYVAAARGYIDNVINPRETRPRLIRALEVLGNPTHSTQPYRKHGNIPL